MTPTQTAPRPDLHRLVEHLRTSRTDRMESIRSVDPASFTDPEIARRERELVFGRVPFVVAHSTELPEPSSFITSRLPRNEVIVVRQQDASVRAFVNACRHRGAMVEGRPSGTCRRFQCPYHGWSYNIDGSLRSATHQVSFGDFDHIETGLVELPVEERHGFVWIIESPGAPIDVADWLGPEMDAILATYGIADHVCFRMGGFDEPANWKLMQDAFLDGYHIQFVHRNSAAKMTYTNVLTIEDYGRHCRFLSPRKSIEPLLERPSAQLTDEDLKPHVNISHGLLPNSTLLVLPDHIELLSFLPHPTDPGRSRMEMRLIVPTLADSGMAEERWDRLWTKNWDILMAVLRDEDFPIMRDAQRALQSDGAGPMILGRNEVANQVFHRELGRLLAG